MSKDRKKVWLLLTVLLVLVVGTVFYTQWTTKNDSTPKGVFVCQ